MSPPRPHDSPAASPWHSIDRQLPLLIALLLVGAVAALALGSYRAVETTLSDAADARLDASARQVSSLLTQSAAQREGLLQKVADHPALRELVTDPDPAAREAAAAELASLLEEEQTLGVALWSVGGSLLAETGAVGAGDGRSGAAWRPPSEGGPGPIRIAGGAAFYDVVAPVPGKDAGGAAAGWLVVRRQLRSAQAAEAISGLIGAEAQVLLGNVAGGAWTDLGAPVAAPYGPGPVTPGRATVVVDGEERLGTAALVANTPWLVWVDVPRAAALAPARDFLRRLVGIALVLLVVGAVVTYGLSRRVSGPLDQLTAAAEALSGGDLETKVPLQRRDEVGRLARAFDRMRFQVGEAQHRLEQRVEERTAELRETVAQLHEAQEELVRRERLAILGQLASGVGHELRNPLGVMTNALFYLAMVLEEATPEVREYLGILRHQVGLSEKIVGDLLDFARIKPPESEPLAVAALAEQQLERLAPGEGVVVERDLPADLPLAYGDPVQLGQVVLNLVTNAAQAMGEAGGTLRVRARVVGTDEVELEVHDSGPGVPAALRERIFEPLFTTKARGIGLGLAVSRALAEANGGSLSLDGEAGDGAAFVLRLPRAPEVGA